MADWERAIAIDPAQVSAHLYIASELDRENKPQAAVAHYKAYLEQDRPASGDRTVLSRNRSLPSCCGWRIARRAHRRPHKLCNLSSWRRHSRLRPGRASWRVSLTSMKPHFRRTAGNIGEALRLYQHALQLDDAAGDRRSSAEDWFTYGQFLDAAGLSLRALCMPATRNPRAWRSPCPNASLDNSHCKSARKQIEKRLGAEAMAIRRESGTGLAPGVGASPVAALDGDSLLTDR